MRTWKRDQPGQYVTNGYTAIKLDRDGKWHVFDTATTAEITLHGLDTLREAKTLVEGEQPKAKPARLTPKMVDALRYTLQAEVGISRSDQSAARSGIVESYMIRVGTAVALIDRGMLTPVKVVEGTRWTHHLEQITAAGCEAIGRSMDEIVEWAWTDAVSAATAGKLPADLNIMSTLPVEVGAVVGWTHKGEAITGAVLGIGGGYATIKGDDASPWSVSLDEIERVIELPKTEAPRRSLALDYPAAEGRVVMQMHADYCAQHGHAQHTSNGVDTGLCPRCGDPTCDHGAPVVGETPSAFEGAAPVRGYADGCQSYGPYPERAPMLDMQASAYARIPVLDDPPRFPEGTPEYEAYSTELHVELEKFAKGEPPYDYPPGASLGFNRDDALLQADLSTGRADRKALPIVPSAEPEPKSLMALVNDAIAAAVHADRAADLNTPLAQRVEARATAKQTLQAVAGRVAELERRP